MSILAPLFLFTALTAYSPVAPAETFWSQCVSKLVSWKDSVFISDASIPVTGPRAINIENIKRDSYTFQADEFMQVMWPTFLKGGDLMKVRSPIFTRFIRENLPELLEIHNRNKTYADIDLKDASDSIKAESLAQYKKVDKYLKKLGRYRIIDFSYYDVMLFAEMFAHLHYRDALEKLIKLKQTPELFKARYPNSNLVDATKSAIYVFKRDRHKYWSRKYGLKLEEPSFPSNLKENIFLALPTRRRTGSKAFFFTYHLPVNPFFLATEFEDADDILSSPESNLNHEWDHYSDRIDTLPLLSLIQKELLKHNLEDLHNLVKAEKDQNGQQDTVLLESFYFLFYYYRFERRLTLPVSLEEIIEIPAKVHNNTSENESLFASLFQRYLRINLAPAPDEAVLYNKLGRLMEIMKRYHEVQKKISGSN